MEKVSWTALAEPLDRADALAPFREEFAIPNASAGTPYAYFLGNSTGLQPKRARHYVQEALDSWAERGVEGHFHGENPWYSYNEPVRGLLTDIVGAAPREICVMNALTVNLHFLLASFYQPTTERNLIYMEANPFPSDRYAVTSQIEWHKRDPLQSLKFFAPRENERSVREDDLFETLEREGDRIAVVLIGHVNYLTGQAFPIAELARIAQRKGFYLGLDLAHGVGNVPLSLHDWGVDFAVWCSYKYLNGGPGAPGGIFVHQKHHLEAALPKLKGWFGVPGEKRFEMKPDFESSFDASSWQVSCLPILSMAALKGSLEVFRQAGFARLVEKSRALTGFLKKGLVAHADRFAIITPDAHGCHLSVRYKGDPMDLQKRLQKAGVLCDFRKPDVLRFAPAPLYCSFQDVARFLNVLEEVH